MTFVFSKLVAVPAMTIGLALATSVAFAADKPKSTPTQVASAKPVAAVANPRRTTKDSGPHGKWSGPHAHLSGPHKHEGHADKRHEGHKEKRIERIVSGVTDVTLTSAATLRSLGVSVSGLGSASITVQGGEPVAAFGITGGVELSKGDFILHKGSGLALTAGKVTVDLRNFVVNTVHDVIYATVTINGTSAGKIAVFSIGSGGTLTLTAGAASALDTAFGTTALTSATVIGTAAVHPVAVSSH